MNNYDESQIFEHLYKSKSPEDFLQLEEVSIPESSRKAWMVAAMHMYRAGRESGREDASINFRQMNDYLDGYNAALEYARLHPELWCLHEEVPLDTPMNSMLDSKGNTVHEGDTIKFHIGIKDSGRAVVDEIYIDPAGTPRARFRNGRYQLPAENIELVVEKVTI